MGTLIGHVAPGVGFLLMGLWHLFNNTKLHLLNPSSYASSPWFPSGTRGPYRYAELLLIILAAVASILMELFIGPHRHQPLDPTDFTIPSDQLHNFEHSLISLSFLIYAACSIHLHRIKPTPLSTQLSQLLLAFAFTQELLMFRLHSADHVGVEGQYHHLLQLVITVTLALTLFGLYRPDSFLAGFVRSLSIAFQGVWFVVMGYAVWTPGLVPKGCILRWEDGHEVVRCESGEALERAKGLVNIEFGFLMCLVVVFAMVFYLVMVRKYGDGEYVALEEDLESLRKFDESKSFVNVGMGMRSLDLER